MCLHAHEIKTNLEKFLNIFCEVEEKTVFLPEVARIVYECALHLNVNNYSSQAKTVADFANRILDWGENVLSEESLKTLFPYTFPLSQPLRRRIQYSCKAPVDTKNPTTSNIIKSEIEKMRLEGNKLFMESNFHEAIEIYSSCINRSKGRDSFDPKLLSNRASAYLRLKQYNNALDDADEYITYSPVCWRGYARKALALHGMNEKGCAQCSAALAFYHNPDIFDKFEPFKIPFPKLKQYIHVCNNVSSLISLLSPLPYVIVSDLPHKIIVLKPGRYCLSAECFEWVRAKQLCLGNVSLVGVSDTSPDLHVTLSFIGNFSLLSYNLLAVNISFIFDLGTWYTTSESVVKLFECSITSNNECCFFSEGSLSVEKCQFSNCKGIALFVVGNAMVEDSVFSGNGSHGVKVLGPGNLVLKNSKLHGNQWGLEVVHGTCDVTDCQFYDNKKIGVTIGQMNGKAKLRRNEIFHNDRHGIHLCKNSSAIIEENEIFENGFWGISAISDAWCRVSRNKIYQNKYGGIQAVPIGLDLYKQSVIEFNQIIGNEGPDIDQTYAFPDCVSDPLHQYKSMPDNLKEAICTGNLLKVNINDGMPPPSQDVPEICFFCHRQGQLKKCSGCFAAGYCNSKCQKSDWEKHKGNCARLLEKYSVFVKVLPLSSGAIGDKEVFMGFEIKAPLNWLEESGPQYSEAPKNEKRFIVKILACDVRRISNDGGTLFAIEDRSLTINGNLNKHEHSDIYHLVRECGSNCHFYGWKKKFFWALLAKNKMVRVLIGDFPTYQRW
jgi:parallel beta-helix repeat protein